MKNKIELAKHYEKLLTAEQFIVTGSTALELHGLDVHSDDLDIILVKPSSECQESLRKLDTLKGTYEGGCACQFESAGIKIDIFIESKPKDCCRHDGLQINPIKDIVAAKNRIGRPKDVAQLRSLAATLSPELNGAHLKKLENNMKILQLSQEKAKEFYENTRKEFKTMLEETSGESFSQSIDTVEEAQKYLGLTNNCYLYISKKHFDRLKAFYHLSLLCDAWNEQDSFVPDFNNKKQEKWYPAFSVAGCGCSFSNASPSHSISYIGSRFCFKSRERSDEFGKKFKGLFKIFLRG